MNIFAELETIVKKNIPLTDYTWYGLGGNADYLIKPGTIDQLKEVVKRCTENGLRWRVLGYGSNLLVRDEGIEGAVIKLEGDEFSRIEFKGAELVAWAGANLGKTALECVRKGLSGMEAVTGIPGTIGGAVKMNAGGNFGDIGSVTESVTLMDNRGEIFEKSKPELVFDYRSVNITAKVILNAKITLAETDTDHLLKTVKEIWIYKKNSQPLSTRNSGCIFKNPRGLSAGALIDRAGLKGYRSGGAEISEKHANFIIAHKECKSSDVIGLISMIKDSVKEQFNVELETEIEIW